MDGREKRELHDEVVQNGSFIAVINAVEDDRMDHWSKQIAEASGQKITWIMTRSRRFFLALGDLEKVCRAIGSIVPLKELDGNVIRPLKKAGGDAVS